MQRPPARHETPYRNDSASPFGTATLCAVQDAPFHSSANPNPRVPSEFVLKPAATQLLAEAHETSLSMIPSAPAGAAAFISVRPLPFHRASSIADAPVVAGKDSPATTQDATERQETAPGYEVGAPP